MEVKLSVVIITYNEERNIARCIDSVKNIADEILIVDSFSTDRTEEICRAKGTTFIKNKFEGHIQQKNFAAGKAKYDRVLSLDADEALNDELKRSITEIKRNWEQDGYYMNRLTNYCGTWIKHCGWYPDKKLRLWHRGKGKWQGINPHDKFEMMAGDQVTGYIKGDILHYSYYTLEDHYKQVNYFTDILAKAYYENGKRAGLKLILSPIAKFIGSYLFHLGFLDGAAGWKVCSISAYASWLKYKKLNILWKHAQ